MKKVINKAKSAGGLALKFKIPLAIFITAIGSCLIWFFWDVIIVTKDELWTQFKANWVNIAFAILFYKLIKLSVYNLVKRFAINKGMDRIKSSLVYSEMDEWGYIYLNHKYKEFENNKFVKAFFKTLIGKVVSSIFGVIVFTITFIKTKLFGFLLGKIFSAQFWTAMLVFISNIPGFFTIFFLGAWIWIETKVPQIPLVYNWIYSTIRYYLGDYWEYIENFSDLILEKIYKIEVFLFSPFSRAFDRFEVWLLDKMKAYIFLSFGPKNFSRYKRHVIKHNAKQLEKKLEKDRLERVRRFTLLRKRAIILKHAQN